MKFKLTKLVLLAATPLILLSGCSDADIASKNLSKAADNFEISRRIVFYNGITGEYMLSRPIAQQSANIIIV